MQIVVCGFDSHRLSNEFELFIFLHYVYNYCIQVHIGIFPVLYSAKKSRYPSIAYNMQYLYICFKNIIE